MFSLPPPRHISTLPISEVAARLIVVRSMGHSGLDLLTLSSSHFDPERTSAQQGGAFNSLASASALFNMTRNLGGAIGIAALQTLSAYQPALLSDEPMEQAQARRGPAIGLVIDGHTPQWMPERDHNMRKRVRNDEETIAARRVL
ncbi:hypothetical protein ACFFWD_41855 [Bradyrhizobium erythrophlei]|uniref:hypothetical protein n=1 Tax=Bradyrhizobium erythrophlei TaxID=1437360 RepID=UPI0035E657D1